MCGGEAQGASWNLVLCQWGIKVQCERSLTVPPFLSFSLAGKTLSQQTVSVQVGAALMLHLLHTLLCTLSLLISFFSLLLLVHLSK